MITHHVRHSFIVFRPVRKACRIICCTAINTWCEMVPVSYNSFSYSFFLKRQKNLAGNV